MSKMVDWQSPETMEANYVVIVRLAHLAGGIYLWEWVVNLGFDYKLIVSAKRFKWAAVIYLACRLTAFAMAVMNLTIMNVTGKIDCAVAFKLLYVFAYSSALLSSALVAIRTIVIWNQNKHVFCGLLGSLVAYSGVLIWVLLEGIHSTWNVTENGCTFSRTELSKVNFTFAIAFDIASLTLALIGVRCNWGSPVGRLLTTLYYQGVIWIFLIVLIYMVPLVLLWLNLSDLMNVMFQGAASFALCIVATRMYRELYEVGHSSMVQIFDSTTSGGLRAATEILPDEQRSSEGTSFEPEINVLSSDSASPVYDMLDGVKS